MSLLKLLIVLLCSCLCSCAELYQGSFDAAFAKAVIQNDTRGVMASCTPRNASFPLNGMPPICYAASYGNEDMIDVLYANGASLKDRNREGRSLAYTAAANGHRSTASKLAQLGAGTSQDLASGASAHRAQQASSKRMGAMQAQAMMWLMGAMMGGGGGGGQSDADRQLQMGQALSAENAAAHYNNQPLPHAGVSF